MMAYTRKKKPKTEAKPPAAAEAAKVPLPQGMGPRLADAEKQELKKEIARAVMELLAEKSLLNKQSDETAPGEIAELRAELDSLRTRVAETEDKKAGANIRVDALESAPKADTAPVEQKVGALQSALQALQDGVESYVELLQTSLAESEAVKKMLPAIERIQAFVDEFAEPVQVLTDDAAVQVALLEENEDQRFDNLGKLAEDLGTDRLRASFERIAKYSSEDTLRERAKESLGQ
jgi:hypothetical protein